MFGRFVACTVLGTGAGFVAGAGIGFLLAFASGGLSVLVGMAVGTVSGLLAGLLAMVDTPGRFAVLGGGPGPASASWVRSACSPTRRPTAPAWVGRASATLRTCSRPSRSRGCTDSSAGALGSRPGVGRLRRERSCDIRAAHGLTRGRRRGKMTWRRCRVSPYFVRHSSWWAMFQIVGRDARGGTRRLSVCVTTEAEGGASPVSCLLSGLMRDEGRAVRPPS